MTDSTPSRENLFLSGSLPAIFVKTAAPIILIMLVNGSFTLVDAYFVGAYVGADALTAVTLMFPLFMLLVALSTLVSSGFSSVLARLIGRGDIDEANISFAQAISLSLVVCVVLVVFFLFGGEALALLVAKNSVPLATMGYSYISILIFFSPLGFVLSVNSDTLRCEGRLPLMAAITLCSVFLNGLFNYFLIVELNWGVVGSAYGTIMAQGVTIAAVAVARKFGDSLLKPHVVRLSAKRSHWIEFLTLGAPSSLGYIGVSLSAGATLLCLQLWGLENYDATVGAYGIITRIMTFIFLPLLGLSMAFQTIVGNNFGAKIWTRANSSVQLVLWSAFVYCAGLQLVAFTFKDSIGGVFVDDMAIRLEVARILPYTTMALFMFGPLMMIGTFFQAIGDAPRAAILGLSRTYAFALPLVFILPVIFGEWGIWYAGPVAEIMVLLLTIIVLSRRAASNGNPFGLFFSTA